MAHLVLADEPLPAEILAMLGADCDVRVWGDGELDTLLGVAEGIYTYGQQLLTTRRWSRRSIPGGSGEPRWT
jgi:hypothetical protein